MFLQYKKLTLSYLLIAVFTIYNHIILANTAVLSENDQDEITHDIESHASLNQITTNLTPSPNEEIDLYSGSFKLHYTDFAVPVAPGLNMEVHRTYNSSLYNPEIFHFDLQFDKYNYNLNLPSWNFGSTYIFEEYTKLCKPYKEKKKITHNQCDLVLHHANGNSELISHTDDDWYIRQTKDNGKLNIHNMIFTDKNGLKYYFNYKIKTTAGMRHYLTRVENLDGHWIQYHYTHIYLSKITSSDPNKVIDIPINEIGFKRHYHYKLPLQTEVLFNNNPIIKYQYTYMYPEHEWGHLALTKVTKTNGESILYNYNFYHIKRHHAKKSYAQWRTLLSSIHYANGEETHYQYTPDLDIKYGRQLHGLRLSSRKHDGVWNFEHQDSVGADGTNNRIVTVHNPYYSTKTTFGHAQNEYAWRIGLPLERLIYTDHTMQTVVKKESFQWDKKTFNNNAFYATSSFLSGYIDSKTYKPLFISKISTIYNANGEDQYQLEQSNYDQYDNPQTTILTSNNGEQKIINRTYYNNPDKNIIGLIKNMTINNNHFLEQDYDDMGHLLNTKRLGINSSYQYINGLISSKTDGLGNITYYQNYSGTTPQTIINSDGTSLNNAINQDGTIANSTDAKGNTTYYNYNNNQQIIKTIPSIGASTTYNYNNFQKTTELDNYRATEEYNHANFLIRKIENFKKAQITQYDSIGRKTFESYPYYLDTYTNNPNHGHYYTYDSLDRLTSDCAPLENLNCTKYNYLVNNTIKTSAPTGEYKIITYKSFGSAENGKPITIQQHDIKTNITRNHLDDVTSITQGKISKYFEYNNNHQLVKYTEPESGTTEYQYDAIGHIITKVLNKQHKIKYSYHPNNYNLLSINYSDASNDENFEYDANNNIIYSKKGNIIKTYNYDEQNRIIDENIIINNIKTDNNTATKLTVSYYYNQKGDLDRIVYPDNSTFLLNPDEYGNPSQLGKYLNNIQYHANGAWQQYHLNNGITASTQLDDLYRVKAFNYGSLNLKYDYDANNNLSHLNLKDDQNTSYHHALDFKYDLNSRITHAKGPWGVLEYTYDQNNNITKIQNPSFKTQDIQFNYDNNLHLLNISKDTNKFNYDDLGNIIRDKSYSYYYGIDQNLLNVHGENASVYNYDTDHNRIIKHNDYFFDNNTIITFYTKSGQALYEYNTKYKRSIKYLYLNNHKVVRIENYYNKDPINTETTNNSKTSYYYNDAIGSPIAMADDSGNILWHEIYEPFGATYYAKTDRKHNKHWFAGKEIDNTNLSYFGARYYNQDLGRFMSPDPAMINPDYPFSFNKYIYANNNPYKYVDPDGRWVVQAMGFSIGLVSGALSAWASGANKIDIMKAAAIGGFVGTVSTLGGSGLISSSLIGSASNASGDAILKAWTGHADKITLSETTKAAGFGAIGGAGGYALGFLKVPNRNLPGAHATFTNYNQPTIRQFFYNHSELTDAPKRAIHSTIQGGIFGTGLDFLNTIQSNSLHFDNYYKNNH